MFINVVITRVILFCPAVPPSPPSAPSLVPRNATSFVSLLAKLLVLRARLSLPAHVREREAFSHERVRSSRPLALRFFHPFFLSPSFLSFLYRETPSRSPSFLMQLSLFLSLSISSSCVLRGVIAHGVSPRSRSFSSSPSAEELLSRWFSYSALSFFFSSFRPLTLPRVAPFPSEFTPERVILPPSATPPPPYCAPLLPPFRVLFCPCRSWCSALFEFKRGSHRCLVSPS